MSNKDKLTSIKSIDIELNNNGDFQLSNELTEAVSNEMTAAIAGGYDPEGQQTDDTNFCVVIKF